MTLKNTAVACLVSAGLATALTHYYFPSIQTKTVEVQKEVVQNDIHTTTHTITQPNGIVDTTTVTDDHSKTSESDSKTAIVIKQPTWNVSGLVANDFSKGVILPAYGVSVSKEILGPFSIGAFGLTNGTIGLSLGVNF